MNAHRRAGLTLVELLVVLAILAIMTTMAVTATNTLVDQARYDATQRTLQAIEEALLGPPNQRASDGTFIISGFFADMGRGPMAVGDNPLLQPIELWDNPRNLARFDLRPWPGTPQVPADPEVIIPSGWRGPYLRLPAGAIDLRDGWGNPFQLLKSNGVLVPDGQWVEIFRGLGADNQAGGTSFDLDTDIATHRQTAAGVDLIDRYSAVITGQAVLTYLNGEPRTAEGPVFVVYFGPNPATGLPYAQRVPLTESVNNKGVYPFVLNNNSIANTITIGPRILRVYEYDVASTTVVHRSRVTPVMVPAGGVSNLIIKNPSTNLPPAQPPTGK